MNSPTEANYDDCYAVVASSINTIVNAGTEFTEGRAVGLTNKLLDCIAYTPDY